jgi:hypothetical protein
MSYRSEVKRLLKNLFPERGPAASLLALCSILACAPDARAGLDYTTGLDVWLDSTDIDGQRNASLTDGQEITSWKNKGTTGVNDAVPAAGINGSFGSTTFSAAGGPGTRGSVTLSNSLYQFGQEFVDSPNITMYFLVNRAANSGVQGCLFTDYGTVGNQTLTVRTGTDSVSGTRDAAGDVTWVNDGAMEADQVWSVVYLCLDATARSVTYGELGNLTTTNMSAAHDATTTFEGTFAGPVTLFGFHDGNNAFDFNGEAAEVLIYDHVLDAAARAQVESYLQSLFVPPAEIAFRITEIVRNPDGGVQLTWNSDPEATAGYTALYNPTLETPSEDWIDADDNIATGGESTSFTIPAAVLPSDATTLFFRIRAN